MHMYIVLTIAQQEKNVDGLRRYSGLAQKARLIYLQKKLS